MTEGILVLSDCFIRVFSSGVHDCSIRVYLSVNALLECFDRFRGRDLSNAAKMQDDFCQLVVSVQGPRFRTYPVCNCIIV